MTANFVNDVFKNSKLSALTLRNRLSALSRFELTKDNYAKVLSNIEDFDDKSKSLNSRITYLFHAISLLKALPESSTNDKLIKLYTQKVDVLKKAQLAKAKVNTLRQTTNFIPLERLQRELNSKQPDFDTFVSNPRTIDDTVRFYKAYEKHLLLSMYINMPATRNDLYACRIVHKKSDINDTENFILISPRSIYLFLTQYKTAGRYGPVRLEVGDINDNLIRNLIKLRKMLKFDNPNLFTHVSKSGLDKIGDETVLIQRIKKASLEYFGQTQSINDFRHAWETHIQHSEEYKNATIAEREQIHMKLLHSLGTALYYNRQPYGHS
jgi:hypothetical protein